MLVNAAEKGQETLRPSVWTSSSGKGRVVAILPAHDVTAYGNEGFCTLIANACRWAARPHSEETSRCDPGAATGARVGVKSQGSYWRELRGFPLPMLMARMTRKRPQPGSSQFDHLTPGSRTHRAGSAG